MNKTSHKTYLDVLKFFSCITVFLSHFRMSFCYDRFGVFSLGRIQIPNIFTDGKLAVCLFLLISNFIYLSKGMSYIGEDYFSRVKKDILNRYIRLFVPAAVVNLLIFVFIKAGLFYNINAVPVNHPDTASWFNLKNHIFLRTAYATANLCFFAGINPPLWCYHLLFLQPLLILLLVPLIRKTDKRVCGVVCFLISAILLLRQSYWAAVSLCFLLWCVEDFHILLKVLALVVSIAVKIFMKTIGMSVFVLGNLLIAVSLVSVLDAIWKWNIDTSVWGGAFTPNEISFSVYLLHMLSICSVGFYLWENVTKNIGLIFLASTACLLAVAIPFHIFVEKKLCAAVLEWIKKLSDKCTKQAKQTK